MINNTVKNSIKELFEVARKDLLSPPIFMKSIRISDKLKDGVKLKLLNGEVSVTLSPKFLGINDWRDILLWIFRHQLAHIHYCPHDLATAYMLEKEAYKILGNWKLSHKALEIMSDLLVDLLYLPRFFLKEPLHIPYKFRKKPLGIENLTFQAYKLVFRDFLPDYPVNERIGRYARDLLKVIFSPRSWRDKQRLTAAIINNLLDRYKKVRKNTFKLMAESSPVPTVEDAKKDTIKEMGNVYGNIKDEGTALAFYENWIKERVSEEEVRGKIKEKLEKVKSIKEKGKGKSIEKAEEGTGEEPYLPTSLSKQIKGIERSLLRDASWRRYWYRSMAENITIRYLSERKVRRYERSWVSYPVDWTADDDIDKLDVDISLEEGPIIPEVTTFKWSYKKFELGEELLHGYRPSLLVILDSSKSMMSSFNKAAVAAFILYLNAKKSGGRTSVVTFSTNYLSGEWNDDDEIKEIILSLRLGEYTIFPAIEALRIIESTNDEVIVCIISDGGWQNLNDGIRALMNIKRLGHRVIFFHIYGWKYEKNMEKLRRVGINVINVENPEIDLSNIAISLSRRFFGYQRKLYWVS